MLNILTEPIIRVDQGGGAAVWVSLPETYSLLMSDRVAVFPALRPHQRHAWHAFLCQLGAIALHRAGQSEPPGDAEGWRALLRGLTADWLEDEPWQLVVADITKPALMQPPAGSAVKAAEFKNRVETPDELDMLVTSKNHDLKGAVVSDANADDWLFALVTLQTMEGQDGRGNYGISRMPSSYGNRPAFSITTSVRPGGHFRRDLLALLEHRQEILGEYQFTDKGIGLLWTKAWDGKRSEALLITQMDPFYIEICRRIRLRQKGGSLCAIRANSDGRRIADVKGLTGDPWSPTSKKLNANGTPAAFVGRRKLSYGLVVDGLFSADWTRPQLLKLTPQDRVSDETTALVARGMVRGKGGTAGYYERVIPLKPKTAQVFGRGGDVSGIADIARERVQQVGSVESILRHAIATFVAHGDRNQARHRNGKPSPNERAELYVSRLDEIVDSGFFDDLQTEFVAPEGERDGIRNRWLKEVTGHAENILKDAAKGLPCPSIHYYKALAQANGVFWGRLLGRNGFPNLYQETDEED